VPERIAHPADLPPAAFPHLDLEPRLRGTRLEHADTAGCGAPVFQPHATAKAQERLARRCALHLHMIDAGHAVARMLQARRELPVVGEQHQAGALQV
jgi:hypothetical protein